MLQTLSSDDPYRSDEPSLGRDRTSALSFADYIEILKGRFFYFLVPFGLISVFGLYAAAIQGPSYVSEGKILVEAQAIAPDIVKPTMSATANDRVQLIEQRLTSRDSLISIANKFGLFAGQEKIPDLMRSSVKFTSVDADGPVRPGATAMTLKVAFAYESPELAMKTANELVTLIVGEDARSRASRANETVKLLADETRDIEDKLQSIQMQISDVARRPNETIPESPEHPELVALANLKAELVQKSSVYSEAHPAVTALKKKIAAMEKSITTTPPVQARSTKAEDIEALKRQRDALQNRLADASSKLAGARLTEKLEREQTSVFMQVLEAPQLPKKPEGTGRLKVVAAAFAAATLLGLGAAIGPEQLRGTIRGRHQLSGVVQTPLIVTVPYITTRADHIRRRLRITFGALGVLTLLTIWAGLAAAIVFQLPVGFSSFDRVGLWSYQTRQ